MNDLLSPPTPTSLIKLHSKDHEEILNVIDQLRSEGISRYLGLPQLIVCGDQSSGKSSVLEALSGLDFPRKDNLCTRFATELILRRAPQKALIVSINPDDDHPAAEKERLRGFKPHSLALEHFNDIVQRAGDFMGVGKDGHTFSKDVLRVELQSPEQPHLTLVDLPGLYHAPDESQDEEGVAFVESLVSRYMLNERSVILAVISAKNDIALQKATSFTRKIDSQGTRTIGVITKPDTLSKGSNMEQSFHHLALNKRVPFSLGWHVLKNRNYEERRMSLEERCTSEREFLSNGIWATLPRRHVGVDALRSRLSMVLRDHILAQLPGLIEETQIMLNDSQESLHRLGEARQTLADQRRYLFQSSERFHHLIHDAVNGVYYDPYFGDAMTDKGYEKRLRSVVQNRLTDFSDAMRNRGASRKIVDDEEDEEYVGSQITRSSFVSQVRQRMRRSRGCELPGTFNPLIVGELFYLHSEPWDDITTNYIELLLSDLQKAVLPMLKNVVDDKSCEGLLRHLINPRFDELETTLRSKTAELLDPQRKGHPITYNHYFIDCVQKARERHRQNALKKKLREFFPSKSRNLSGEETHSFNVDALVDSLAAETESDMEKFACSEAIDCMLAYYKVARKKFVDDFSNLAIEKCLLEPLPAIFTSQTVNLLEDSIVADIAAEDEISRHERILLEEKVKILQTSLQRLHALDRHHLTLLAKTKNEFLERRMSVAHENNINEDGAELDDTPKEPVKEHHPTDNVATEILDYETADGVGDTSQNASFDFTASWDGLGRSSSTKRAAKKKHRGASMFE